MADGAAQTSAQDLSNEARIRVEMAAALRWSARLGLNEAVANHFSVALDAEGKRFLINPYGVYWSRMRASDMVLLHADEEPTDTLGDRVDRTAWAIHGALHRNAPHARAVCHLHPHYATALSALADPTLPPIDQNTMRFFNRVSIDHGFDGMGLGDEAERLSTAIGDKPVLMMGNHGVLTAAETMAEAFDLITYFELAARTYMTALATGRPLAVVSDAVAEKTARQWEDETQAPHKHLGAIIDLYDAEEPDFRG